jgi:hypothetical protein
MEFGIDIEKGTVDGIFVGLFTAKVALASRELLAKNRVRILEEIAASA